MKKTLGILFPLTGLLLPVLITPSALASRSSHANVIFASAYAISSARADSLAVQAVGGGTVMKTSLDTYQNQRVYDIHVQDHGAVYDVKVNSNTGAVMQKKLSQEQPSPSTAPATPTPTSSPSPATSSPISRQQGSVLAVQAVGGGTVQNISADHAQGIPVWDVHVLYQGQVYDVKINQESGAVLTKRLSQESSSPQGSQDSSSPQGEGQSSSQSSTSTVSGVPLNTKLQTVPPGYQNFVQQAIQLVGGGTLKWVKFTPKHGNELQMNIKIRRASHGTIKVKDVFSANRQLLSQKTNS